MHCKNTLKEIFLNCEFLGILFLIVKKFKKAHSFLPPGFRYRVAVFLLGTVSFTVLLLPSFDVFGSDIRTENL